MGTETWIISLTLSWCRRISGAVFPEKIHEECEKCKNQKEQHNNQKTEKRKNLLCKSKGFQ